MTFDVTTYSRAIARGAKWCLDHAWLTFGVTVVALLVSGVAASRLAVDPSPEAYLVGGPVWDEFARVDRTYAVGETIVVALHEPGGTVFDADTVNAVARLDERLSAIIGVRRVLSIASASVLGNVGKEEALDVIDVGLLLPEGEITQDTATILGQRIINHKVYPRVLIDRRHETAFILVQLDSDAAEPVSRLDTTRDIRDLADTFRTQSRTVHLGGPPMTKEAIATGVERDTYVFFPATILLLVVLLWLMFGDPLASLIPIAVTGFASVLVLGTLGALGTPLNMATVMVPTIILVVGLADSVHLLAELRRQFARSGDRELSLVRTIEAVALPCLLTSATSAIGFAVLIFSRIIPLREFGAATALGLVVAYITSMFLTPVLLSAVRYPKDTSKMFVAAPRMGRALTNFAIITGRNVLVPIAGTGLLCGICVAAISQIEINSDFLGYLGPDHRLRRDLAVIGSTLGGADTLDVVLEADTIGAFLQPDLLAKADEVGIAIRSMEGVHGAIGFVDYLKLANSVLDPKRGWALPLSRNAVSQVMLLEAEGFPALASPDMQQIRMSLQVPSMPSESLRQLAARIATTARSKLEGTTVKVTVTGVPLLFADVVRSFVEEAASSFGLVALSIWIAMLIGFRSFSLATVAMIPNLLPIGMTFATMAVVGIEFDTNSAFIGCLGIGIAVDDTVHIVARYQRAREQGSPTVTRALRYSLTHAGHPVMLTSILLVVGFLVLCLSSFVPTVRVGMLGSLLVIYAVVFDLCLLPALLLAVDRISAHFEPKERTRPSPITGSFEEAASHLTTADADDSNPQMSRP